MSNNGDRFGDNRGASWSAVCCPLFPFPQDGLAFHAFAMFIISLDHWIKGVFNGKFKGQAGPRQLEVSRLDARLKCATPGMDWVFSQAQAPLSRACVVTGFGSK